MKTRKNSNEVKTSFVAEESFRDFFFSTVDKTFLNQMTYLLNRDDALTVMCNAYIDMYFNRHKLKYAPSREWWIRKTCQTSYRKCIRNKNLSLAHEYEETDVFPVLTDQEKMSLWTDIKKISDINTFAIIPTPYGSITIRERFKGFLRQISLYRLIKTVLLTSFIAAGVFTGLFLVVKVLPMFIEKNVKIPEREIYLSDDAYDGYFFMDTGYEIDESVFNETVADAQERGEQKRLEEEAAEIEREESSDSSEVSSLAELDSKYSMFLSRDPGTLIFSSDTVSKVNSYEVQSVEEAGSVGNSTAGTIEIGDEWLDNETSNVVSSLLSETMTDTEKLSVLYRYVCRYGSYGEPDKKLMGIAENASYFFKYRMGTSQNYASAFVALCRSAGYDCDVLLGSFVINSGESDEIKIPHYWCVVKVNGISYHFDPEADSNATGTGMRNYYFMAADGNLRWKLFCRDHIWE